MGVTERLARASSRHPWRVLLGWLGAIVVALGLAVTLLPGNLTTNGHVTGNPESAQAERIFYRDFPPDRARRRRADRRPLGDRDGRGSGLQAVRRRARSRGRRRRESSTARRRLRASRGPARAPDRDPAPGRRRSAPAGGRAEQRARRLQRRDDRRGDARPRLQRPLPARPQVGRARVRPSGGADRAVDRLRQRGRRADPARDGDHLDRRRARALRADRGGILALGLLREHAHGHGPGARDRLLAVRPLALPRGADRRPRRTRGDRRRRARPRAARCSSAARSS